MAIKKISEIFNLSEIKEVGKLNAEQKAFKDARDKELKDILEGVDKRLLLVIGPCSAHDEEAVLAYCKKLSALQEEVADELFIVPRIYTNKPRTNGDGYKGLLHHQNPESEQSNLLNGILAVRNLHYKVITQTALTTADEMLYPENMEIVEDLISYHAIGARSVEDQQHRFVASGISSATGLKNPTSGNMHVLFNALYAAKQPQNFLYNGAEVETTGNPLAHIILRGSLNEYGENTPNFYYENLLSAIKMYEEGGFTNPFIVIDTNHDNSGKNYLEQIRIVKQTLINREWNEQVAKYVRGFMIESYLEDGRQEPDGKIFGKSITDPCLGWEKTEKLIRFIYENCSGKKRL